MKSGCMSFAGSRSKDQTRGVSKRQPAKPSGKINKYKTPPSQPQCAAYNLQWDWFTALICCGQINIFIPQMPLMKSSYRPHCTNRYVRHRLSEGRLSTLQLTLQPSMFPEHGIKSGLELPTNLLNFRKVINYIPPQFKIHLFPFNEKNPSLLHLFSMRWCELPGLTTERRKVWESAVGVGVGQLAEALRQSAVGLEGDAGGHAGSERRNREGSLFIMADCLSVWFPAPTHCFP